MFVPGLFCCYCWPCTFKNGQVFGSLLGILLYIVQCNTITVEDLVELQRILDCFHTHHEAFIGKAGVTGECISLPCQHSLMHYICCIILFSSLNGLCSSITESKHIKAVKEPWQWSSQFKALKQTLVTISQMDKLSIASWAHTELGWYHIFIHSHGPKGRRTAATHSSHRWGGWQWWWQQSSVRPKDSLLHWVNSQSQYVFHIWLICIPYSFPTAFSLRLPPQNQSSCKPHWRAPIHRAFTKVFIRTG